MRILPPEAVLLQAGDETPSSGISMPNGTTIIVVSFVAAPTATVTRADFLLGRVGTLSQDFRALLYTTTSIGTCTPVGLSDPVSGASIPTTADWITFSGLSAPISGSTSYWLGLVAASAVTTGNTIDWRGDFDGSSQLVAAASCPSFFNLSTSASMGWRLWGS